MKMFKSAFILLLVTLISGAALGFVNDIAAEPIRIQEEKTLKESMQIIFPDADDFKEETAENELVSSVFTAVSGGNELGYILESTTMGYGGEVTVLTGIDLDGSVVGVRVTGHSETPGLGANAEKDSFLSQYEGADSPLSVVKLNPASNEVEAITSATITTNAVTDNVNNAIEYYKSVISGGGN